MIGRVIMLRPGVLETAPADIRRDVDRGVDILKAGGCRQVFVLGSVAEGRCDSNSDHWCPVKML